MEEVQEVEEVVKEEVEEVGEKRGMFGCDAYQVLMREIKVPALRLLQSRHIVEKCHYCLMLSLPNKLCVLGWILVIMFWLSLENYHRVNFLCCSRCQQCHHCLLVTHGDTQKYFIR